MNAPRVMHCRNGLGNAVRLLRSRARPSGFHGGKSTGPKTKAGRARIAAAHTVHGRETRQKRADTSAKLAELHQLEQLGFTCGLYPEGTERMRGRKPKGMSGAAVQLSYLHNLVREERKEAILEILRRRIEGIS